MSNQGGAGAIDQVPCSPARFGTARSTLLTLFQLAPLREISLPGFALIDWLVVAAYLALVLGIGALALKRRAGSDDFFLAGRSMPMWAVAISILATAQSAATFIGGPQESFTGDLTYLSTNIGSLIASVVVAVFFIPAFYRRSVTSVYELIGSEMGTSAQRLASAMYMIGRVFASGARLFIVAIPFALLVFGDLKASHMAMSIVIVTTIATLYSTAGGIRAVIWTDVLQVVIYITCITLALLLIWQKIPLSVGEAAEALRMADGGDKLRVFDFSADPANDFTVWAAVIGFALFNIAAYGADQDLTQRMLTCRTARRASWSVIAAMLIGLPVVLLFLVMGLLLHLHHAHPEWAGAEAAGRAVVDSRRVFLDFIFHEMPAGVRGLMIAGVFAAAMSSLDSGLNAMSSTTIADFYRPWRLARDPQHEVGGSDERRIGRFASVFWAAMIGGFALLCIFWYDPEKDTLIRFALGVMTFAYAGLLGVFFTAIFTKRGNAVSAAAAMAVGFGIVLLLDPTVYKKWTGWFTDDAQAIAFPWHLTIAATVSFVVCVCGRREARLVIH